MVRLTLFAFTFGAALVSTFVLAPRLAHAQSEPIPTTRYTVQAGDTCAAIANRFFHNRFRHDVIHSYNPGMGPPPHDLVAGTVLVLPIRLPTAREVPDARVTTVRRSVLSRRADAVDWQQARRGEALFRGWRVNTLESSSAQVTFQDTSRIEVRANTLIVIYGGASTRTRVTTTTATLETGTLRTRLGTLRMRVETPSSVSTVDGGATVVSTDATGSRVSTHSGAGARVVAAGRRGASVRVRPGYGSVVTAGRAPSTPRPLPAAPLLAEGRSPTFLALGSYGATVEGTWAAVPGAIRYHVEIGTDEAQPEVLVSTDVEAGVDHFSIRGLPPGRYTLSISTIDPDGLESVPSSPFIATVLGVVLHVPGSDDQVPSSDVDGLDSNPTEILVPPGAFLSIPPGLICPGTDAVGRLVFDRVGAQSIECRTASGDPVHALSMAVQPSDVSLSSGSDSTPTMGRGTDVVLPLQYGDAATPIPSTATWEVTPGLEIVAVDLVAKTITLRATDAAPRESTLRMMLPTTEGQTVEVGRLVLDVEEIVVEPPALPDAGVVASPADTDRRATGPSSDVASHLADPTAMGAVSASDRDVEVGASLAVARFANHPSTAMARFHFGLRLHERLFAEVTVGGAVPAGHTPSGYGAFAYGVGARSLLFSSESVTLIALADLWIPVRPFDVGVRGTLFRPSLAVAWSPTRSLTIRSRAGTIVDFGDEGLRTFVASAMVDLRPLDRLGVGIELNAKFGRMNGDSFTTAGVGAYVAYDVAAWSLSTFLQFEPTTAAQRLAPAVVFGAGARTAFDVSGDSSRP